MISSGMQETACGILATACPDGLWLAYEPERVRSVAGYDADFKPVSVKVQARDHHSVVEAPDETAVLTAFFDNGYWVQT